MGLSKTTGFGAQSNEQQSGSVVSVSQAARYSSTKDGTGVAAAVRFATVSTGLAMTNNDFVVV